MKRLARSGAGLPILGLGLATLSLAVLHAVLDQDPVWAEALEGSILVAFAVAILFVAYRVTAEGSPPATVLRITTVSLGGGLAVGLLAALFLVVRRGTGEPMTEPWFVLSIGWSVGTSAGSLVGYYYHRFAGSLAHQRDLAKRLTVLQRVLRHNLRNETTIIAGAARDAGERVDDPVVDRKLGLIERHVNRIADLSADSQQLTRIWQTDERTTRDLAPLLEHEIDQFADRHPEVPLEVTIESSATVRVHPQVRLAIREALENAVAHNEAVEVRVSAGEPARRGERQLLPVEVADTGDGIPAAELEPLWKPEERPLEHSSGLGLWLIYWLVELSGGDLEVDTDDGTVVRLWLPVA